MNFNHLHHFYVVVREGGVSAASRKLRVSQPSLSSQIKCFESDLGVSLFQRKGNKLELTPSGKTVYANAAKMFEISASIPELVTKSPEQGPTIKIGVADEIERPFAVGLVKTLFQKWVNAEMPMISFSTGYSEDLLGKLRSWTVDTVITNRPTSYSDLEIVGSLVLPVYLAIGRKSKLNAVECDPKDIGRILQHKKYLALPSPRLKLREEIDLYLSNFKRRFPISFESDTLATVIRAVTDDVGVSFLPLPYIAREVRKKEILIVGPPEGLWNHTVFLLRKTDRGEASGVAKISEAFEDLKANIESISNGFQFSKSLDSLIESII